MHALCFPVNQSRQSSPKMKQMHKVFFFMFFFLKILKYNDSIFITVMILSFQTDMPGQTVQTQIRLLLKSSLIRVYTVCHSVCIIWTHYSMVQPHSSNVRVITTNFLGVRIFWKFMVIYWNTFIRSKKYAKGQIIYQRTYNLSFEIFTNLSNDKLKQLKPNFHETIMQIVNSAFACSIEIGHSRISWDDQQHLECCNFCRTETKLLLSISVVPIFAWLK